MRADRDPYLAPAKVFKNEAVLRQDGRTSIEIANDIYQDEQEDQHRDVFRDEEDGE